MPTRDPDQFESTVRVQYERPGLVHSLTSRMN